VTSTDDVASFSIPLLALPTFTVCALTTDGASTSDSANSPPNCRPIFTICPLPLFEALRRKSLSSVGINGTSPTVAGLQTFFQFRFFVTDSSYALF
jgi:hypothetical protein